MLNIKRSFYTSFDHNVDVDRLEPVDCDFCGSSERSLILKESGFDIVTCRRCGLVYVTPQPSFEDLPRFYESMYAGQSADDESASSLGYVERHLARIIQRERPAGGDFLEVGCGYGKFLEQMASKTWRLTGLEMSETAIEKARQRVPSADIAHGDVYTAEFEPNSFDCIALIAVFEHLKKPAEALANVTKWLRPGGLLLIQVPYVAAYMRLKRWIPALPVYFEAPRHLFDFSPALLRKYFDRAGFENLCVEVARPYSSPTRIGEWMIWAVKIPGLVLHALSGGRYVYPFAGASVIYGTLRNDI
jgi:SAM-dependent methyltransferase